MAKTDKPAVEVDPGEELVPVFLFKDSDKYSSDLFVCVNGESVQIQRGKQVMIKKKFADVIQESMEQDMKAAEMMAKAARGN